MTALADLPPSQLAIVVGVVFLLLGSGLGLVSAARRLNELGQLLLGFFFGAGLALAAGGVAFNAAVPHEMLYRGSTSVEPVNLGDYLTAKVRLVQLYCLRNLKYLVPTGAILLLGLRCLAVGRLFARIVGSDFAHGLRGFITALLIPLAILSVAVYTNWASWRSGSYFNAYEFYHYYIGTKYAPEVGYEDMYNASLIADEETGLRYLNSKGTFRDLSTGAHVKTAAFLKDTKKRDAVKARFSEARWQEFVKDIRYFKQQLTGNRWSGILSDKGYNGTPYWSMLVGGLLSERVDTNNGTGMMALALLDPLLICVALACVWWAFGVWPMLLMVVLIGTSYVMSFSHMKGAFLRTDFAMALVIAVCMLKRRHHGAAGALMMYAALSRVFPAVFFFGAGVKLLQNVALHWRPRPARLFQGLLTTLALGLVLTVLLHIALPPDWRTGLSVRVPFLSHVLQGMALGIAFEALLAFAVASGLVALWLFSDSPQCRPQVRLFASAFAVLVIATAAVMLDPRTGKTYVDDFANKIGRHLTDISVWRVGYKYLFINNPAIRNERLKAQRQETVAQVQAATVSTADDAQDESADADADTAPETPPSTTPATKAPREEVVTPADETGFVRVWVGTWRDMRFAAEKAWTKALKDTKADERGVGFGTLTTATRNFLKGYVPSTRSQLYLLESNYWRLTMAMALALSFLAVLALKDHEALAFSFVPFYFLVAPTYYYYIVLTVPLLFFTSRLHRPQRVIGAMLMLASAMPGYYLYGPLGYGQQYATYYWHCVVFLLLCGYMVLIAYGEGLAGLARRAFRRT